MSDTLDRNRDSFEFDALAELFLGDKGDGASEAPPPRPSPPNAGANGHRSGVVGTIGIGHVPLPGAGAAGPAKPLIEALVIGHLPVRTGPWLSQYAAAIARAEQTPVALLRLSEGDTRIDLVGPGAGAGAPAARQTTLPTLEQAIGVAAGRTRRWTIQVGDLDVPWLLRSPLVDSITLLAGGNEAALVDAYRTIKSLVAGCPPRDDGEGDTDGVLPVIRLAIMGADEDRARSVAERLRDASRAFLGREIELAAGVREMGPTSAAPLYRGSASLDIRAILDEIRRGSRSRPIDSAPSPTERQAAPRPPEPETTRHAQSRAEPPAPPPTHARAAEPAPAPQPERIRLPLAAHLEALTALPIPYADDAGVQFAIDPDARLHILRFDEDGDADAVAAMTAAGAWARRNLVLLNMAISPHGPIRADEPPTLHLFTRRPKALRPLLDAEIRLHALAPVRPECAWISLDLN